MPHKRSPILVGPPPFKKEIRVCSKLYFSIQRSSLGIGAVRSQKRESDSCTTAPAKAWLARHCNVTHRNSWLSPSESTLPVATLSSRQPLKLPPIGGRESSINVNGRATRGGREDSSFKRRRTGFASWD